MTNPSFPAPAMPPPEAWSILAEMLRKDDRDRYLTALLAPPDAQQGLLALYAFNLEIARVRETVSEELIGRMRLQWWRDRLDGFYAGKPAEDGVKGHPLAEPLTWAVHRFDLDRSALDDLINAREADLVDEQPAGLADLESYAKKTAAPVVTLALRILGQADGPVAAVAEDIAVAQVLTGVLRSVPFDLRRGWLRLPADLCHVAALDTTRLRDRGPTGQEAQLAAVVKQVADRAGEALARARARRTPRAALPALLPARLAARDLKRLARAGHDPFAGTVIRIDGLRPLILLSARLGGKF